MEFKKRNVAILGTGAYGTVLANVLADNGHDVIMYGRDENKVNDINENKLNSAYFNYWMLNAKIRATQDFVAAIENAEIVVVAVPTTAMDEMIDRLIRFGKRPIHIVSVAKGMDDEQLDVLSKKLIKKLKPTPIWKTFGGIYGPSMAIEVLQRKPTCVMSANENKKDAEEIADLFTNEYFKVVPTTDLVGCEVAATLKNTIAIASGILNGFAGADNAKASLITIGLNEMINIASKIGAKTDTFFNFACLGDLVLTAHSSKSRNYKLGMEIADANDATSILKTHKVTVEGVKACDIAHAIIKKYKIEAPLFEIMYEILYNNGKPSALINEVFRKAQVI